MATNYIVSNSLYKVEYKEIVKNANGVKFFHSISVQTELLFCLVSSEKITKEHFCTENKQINGWTKVFDIKFHAICEFVHKNNGILRHKKN